MTEHDRDEARLRALFDSTAEEPDRMQLTKLRARAAEVAATRRRRPWWQLFVPAAVAGAALFAVLATRTRDPETPSPAIASFAAPTVEPAPAVTPKAAVPVESGDLGDPELDAPLAGASLFADESGDLLAPLDEPADDESDVWLSAAGAFLEDG